MQSAYMADLRLIRFLYLFSGHSYKEWILGQIQLNKLEYFCHSLQPPFCCSCCDEAIRLRYIASVSCVCPPGKHISLVICVRGNTYHGGAHITVTSAFKMAAEKTLGTRLQNSARRYRFEFFHRFNSKWPTQKSPWLTLRSAL